jgi:hypothetical protein
MSRNVLFVLLLATGVAQAEPQGKTEAAQGQAPAVQAKTEAAQGQTPAAQVKTEPKQEQTKDAQAKTEASQAQTEEPQAKTEEGKLISTPGGKALGMSILGNQEAPTALVIVPWKTSELGGSIGNSPMLDDSRQPIDKEVFIRALRYYEIRSKTKP